MKNWKLPISVILNHEKSSGSMEAARAVEIFQHEHSVQKHKLVWISLFTIGDSSSFKEVVESNSHSEFGIVPEKVECAGHVQKRLVTCWWNMANEYKGAETLLSGKGKLTEKVTNSLQNFYGIAIRQKW